MAVQVFEGHLCDVPGILVGHVEDDVARTGCTAILCREGAVGGVCVRGGGPGTTETDLLRCGRAVPGIHGVVLTGGSAFGLATASGVRQYLEEQGVGLDVGGGVRVPLVCGGVIFDLGIGDGATRPNAAMGYAAAKAARADTRQGCIGAGCGATVGKLLGMKYAMRGGVGSASLVLPEGARVAALAVVNALGDVVDPATGRVLAGLRDPANGAFLDSSKALLCAPPAINDMANTTLAVVATDAALDREQANRMAEIAQDGLALSIRPCHTQLDGDTVFALSVGDKPFAYNALLHAACIVTARAIQNAVCDSRSVLP